MAKKDPHCPQCQSKKVVPILYGMPTMEAVKESEAGKLFIGGCCIDDESPEWYCLGCENEFGNYLNTRNLDFLIPIKLSFSIGKFSADTHFVKLVNGRLQHGSSVGSPEYGEIKGAVLPSELEWNIFKNKLDDIGVWKWKKKYNNPNILDGTQWKFEIEYSDQKVKSYGSNSYPDEFNELRAALSLLCGKDNIV